MTKQTYTELPHSGAFIVRGADRVDFVQGQLANDVRNIPVGEAVRSLALNLRGQALADVNVIETGEEFCLVVEDNMRDWLMATFDQHIIFDQVELAPLDAVMHFTMQGPGASELQSDILAAGATHVWSRARTQHGGIDVLVPDAEAAAVVAVAATAGFNHTSMEEHTAQRILAGLPLAAQDGGEGVLPQEAGLESALSYRKGCYLGQEIMARIEARGNLRRELATLVVPCGNAVPDRANITNEDGRTVGRVGSQAPLPDGRRVVLAVIRNDLDDAVQLNVDGISLERYQPNS